MPVTRTTMPHRVDILVASVTKTASASQKRVWTLRDASVQCFIQPMVDLPSVPTMQVGRDYNCDVYFAADPNVDVQEVTHTFIYRHPTGEYDVHEVRESINLCRLSSVWQIRTYFRSWKRLPAEFPP